MTTTLRVLRLPLLLLLLAGLAPGPETAGAAGPLAAVPQAGVPQGGGRGETAEPPDTFVPSEKVPADSAVSFPVDI